jgi:NADH:ubiquinone oxidoreductase subunit H
LDFAAKTILLLAFLASMQALLTRLRIDQTVGLWWRYGALLVLAQYLVVIVWEGIAA